MKILETIKASWSSPDIRRRIILTLLIIIAFRFLAAVPVPGIDRDTIKNFYNSPAGGALQFFNTFSGGTLDSFSILSVGLIPFINASVIFQLLPTIIKRLEQKQKEGENGRKQITQYTRLLTVPLAILTSITIFITLKSQGVIAIDDPLRVVSTIAVLTGGAIFMMWMGEIMTEKGIGNGISIIIMVGILAAIPGRFINQIAAYNSYVPYLQLLGTALVCILVSCVLVYLLRISKNFTKLYFKIPALLLSFALTAAVIVTIIVPKLLLGLIPNDRIKSFGDTLDTFIKAIPAPNAAPPVELGMILGFAVVVIGLIVIFNEAAKNLPIYFARKATTSAAVAKKSYMPLKILQAGVMPIIFSSALLLFPYTIAIIVTRFNVPVGWLQDVSKNIIAFLDPPDWKYWALNFAFTVFFAYFYTFVLFRPSQVADNLKKSGGYIPGIRPGLETQAFLTRTMLHLVFAGAIVLALMSTTQAFVGGGLTGFNQPKSLLATIFTSGTSLLITVGVVLDTRRQFRSYLAQRNYDMLFEDLDMLDTENYFDKKEEKPTRFGRLKRLIRMPKINFSGSKSVKTNSSKDTEIKS